MIDITCIKISCKLPGLLVDLETYLTLHQKGQGHAFHFELYQSIHCKSKAKKRIVQIQNKYIHTSIKEIYWTQRQHDLYQRNSWASCWAWPLKVGILCHTAWRNPWGLTWAHRPDHKTRNSPFSSWHSEL